MDEKLPVAEAVRLLRHGTKGRFFSCCFIKRSTGEERIMNARMGVKKHLKGGDRAYNPEDHNLIWTWDRWKEGPRSISIEGLKWLKVDGKKIEVDHSISTEIKETP